MLFEIRKKFWKRSLAWVLTVAILLQPMPVYATDVSTAEENPKPKIEITEETTEETTEEEPDVSEKEEAPAVDSANVYEDGVVKIYTLSQLRAIGTNRVVTTSDDVEKGFGKGEPVKENGAAVTYSSEQSYRIMGEIELDAEEMWTLPDDFTGCFLGEAVTDGAKLYDASSDTIYIYNNYQLKTVNSEKGHEEPVMSQDMIPEKFGIGQIIYGGGVRQ